MMKRIWGYSWYPVECQIADGFGNICDHPVIGKGKFFRPVEKVEAYAVPEADIKKSPAAKPGIFALVKPPGNGRRNVKSGGKTRQRNRLANIMPGGLLSVKTAKIYEKSQKIFRTLNKKSKGQLCVFTKLAVHLHKFKM